MIILESQRDHYGFGGGLERHSSKSPPPFKDAVIVEKKNRDVDYTAKFTEERKGKRVNMMLMKQNQQKVLWIRCGYED